MALIQRYLKDQHGRPIAGAVITIRDATTGALAVPTDGAANPATTDSLGLWAMTLANGDYVYVAKKGDDFIAGALAVSGGAGAPAPVPGVDYSIYMIQRDWLTAALSAVTLIRDP